MTQTHRVGQLGFMKLFLASSFGRSFCMSFLFRGGGRCQFHFPGVLRIATKIRFCESQVIAKARKSSGNCLVYNGSSTSEKRKGDCTAVNFLIFLNQYLPLHL